MLQKIMDLGRRGSTNLSKKERKKKLLEDGFRPTF